MTDKCELCNGTKIDRVLGGACTWCDETGKKNGLNFYPTPEVIAEALTYGVSVVTLNPAEGAEHVPLKDFLVDLKPFRLLPYGAKFRHRGTNDAWVRIGNNLIAEWPGKVFDSAGEPRQSLCCFCHLDGDEDSPDGLDTLVEVVDQDSELAALREELARKDVVIEDMLQSNSDMTTCLAAAERRNAEMCSLLAETSKAILRHQAEQLMSHRLARLLTKARAKVDRYLKAVDTQPTESGAGE